MNGVKTWAIGQALMVERRMNLMLDSKYAGDGLFPELAFFDCHSCHSPMSQSLPTKNGNFPAAWSPRPGTGVGPGVVKFNDSNMLMLKIALDMAGSNLADKMASDMRALHKAAQTSRGAMTSAASAARETARAAVKALSAKEVGKAEMMKAAKTLAQQSSQGFFADYESAEQATMALGAFVEAMRVAGHIDSADYDNLSKQMEAVYGAVSDDEAFIRGAFISAVKKVNAAL